MEWTEEMSVRVKVLDDDHKALIEILNDLNDGIEANRSRVVLEDVIERLSNYIKIHFAREERMFAQTGYAGSAAHTAEHALLAKRMMNLQSRFECGQSRELGLETLAFLKNWLIEHIMISDQMYGSYFNAKGIK
jgi:hemerythrin-like metal-binding protein